MISVLLTYLIYFAVGFAQDFIITFYYQAIAKEKAASSAALSTIITLVNIFVLYAILNNVGQQVASVIIVYALGNGAGTFTVVKWFKGGKRKR